MPKTVDTRMHCGVRLRAYDNLPQPYPYTSVFGGSRRLLHALNPISQCLLVSTVLGTVSTLHFTLVDYDNYSRLAITKGQ